MKLYDFSVQDKLSYRKLLRRNPHLKLKQSEFSKIIKTCNEYLMEYALDTGKPVKLPYGGGTIQCYRLYQPVTTVDTKGKKRINLAVNWGETRKLWESDPEAKEKKTLVRFLSMGIDGYTILTKWRSSKYMAMRNCWSFKRHKEVLREAYKRFEKDPAKIYNLEDWSVAKLKYNKNSNHKN